MALDFDLGEEHVAIRDTIRRCLEPFAARRAELLERIMVKKELPQDLWDAICATGLMGCVVPERYGGNGMGLLASAVAIEELASLGYGNALLVLGTMDAACIVRHGSEATKERYLPGIASGALKFCFAITEPNAGTNAFRIETIARRDGDVYRVSGQKTFITGVDVADRMLLVCRTTSREDVTRMGMPKAFGLALLVVDTKAEGITLTPIPTRGIEGLRQFTVFFDEVRVPAEDLIGHPDSGALVLFNSLNPERILAAATACGMARYCLDKSVRYANERVLFGDRPIGAYQAISHPLALVKMELEAARLMTWKSAWAFDRDRHPAEVGSSANTAKYLATEMAVRAVDRAIQTHGGYGFSEEYGIIWLWEAVRLLRTAPVTAEMILNFVAEHDLGLPRGY